MSSHLKERPNVRRTRATLSAGKVQGQSTALDGGMFISAQCTTSGPQTHLQMQASRPDSGDGLQAHRAAVSSPSLPGIVRSVLGYN